MEKKKNLSVLDRARRANGLSRMCRNCNYYLNPACIDVCRICANSFIEGLEGIK